mgnify:CR=1 FL=1
MKNVDSAMTFVTQGKDIENYINPEVIREHCSLEKLPKQVGLYDSFEDYLNRVKKGKGTTFHNNKVLFAERVKDLFIKEDLAKVYDIDKQMKKIVTLIRAWNKA